MAASVASVRVFPEIALIVPTGGGVLGAAVCDPDCASHRWAATSVGNMHSSAANILRLSTHEPRSSLLLILIPQSSLPVFASAGAQGQPGHTSAHCAGARLYFLDVGGWNSGYTEFRASLLDESSAQPSYCVCTWRILTLPVTSYSSGSPIVMASVL